MLDLQSLNEAQRKAVTHGEGPLLVLAGPGSGKTFTITQRIFYLLQKLHVPPEQILVVTFTKDAALSMQRRFQEQSNQVYPVNFGTFHSIFYHILRESRTLQAWQIAAEEQKKAIITPLLARMLPMEERPGQKYGQKQYGQKISVEEAALFLAAFSFYKNTGDKDAARGKLPGEWKESFSDVFQAYEQERKRRRLIDFDDMVYQCRELLTRDAQMRRYWQGRFSHILMDEFQDINPMQYEVVKLLAGRKCSLFAVGDDDQSIYGFRGSRPACLRQFAEEFQARQACLTVNYRSDGAIVEASLRVISENKERFVKKLTAVSGQVDKGAEAFKISRFEEKEEQYAYLAEQLKSHMQIQDHVQPQSQMQFQSRRQLQNHVQSQSHMQQPASLAVLFRTNSFMQAFGARLSRQGIPYSMKEKVTSIYRHFIVEDIMAYLRLSEGKADRELMLRILNKPLRYLNREALGWKRRTSNPKMQSLGSIFQGMKDYYRMQDGIPCQAERIWALEQLERNFQYLEKLPLYLRVQYILKGMGYEKHLREMARCREEKWQEWQEVLEWLCEESKNYGNAAAWEEAQREYEKTLREAGEERGGQRIQLMTVHASKGLEFDYVWIPDCNENVFPHGRMPEEPVCEEERRIFYVAMTRAKKSLELLYLTGTKERPRLPSRFLNPLFSS